MRTCGLDSTGVKPRVDGRYSIHELTTSRKDGERALYSICHALDCLLGFFLCLFVCLPVSPSLPLVRFGQLLRRAGKRIVNILNAYMWSAVAQW